MKKARGTWKIAYADFITALMVMFLLMWLIGSVAKEDLQGISKYFNGIPQISSYSPRSRESGEVGHGKYVREVLGSENLLDLPASELKLIPSVPNEAMEVVSNVLESIRQSNIQKEFADNVCVYWHNGVVIEVFDTHGRALFASSTSELMPWSRILLKEIAVNVLKHQPRHVTIDGHAAVSSKNVDCWLLSFQRANSVRQHIAPHLDKQQIIKVTGNGDADLLVKDNPNDPSNMRISITIVDTNSLRYRQQNLPDHILGAP